MIELSLTQKEKVKEQMRKAFCMGYPNVNLDKESLEHNYQLWAKEKEVLYNLFRKDEHWDQDNLCIHVKVKTKRMFNTRQIRDILSHLKHTLFKQYREKFSDWPQENQLKVHIFFADRMFETLESLIFSSKDAAIDLDYFDDNEISDWAKNIIDKAISKYKEDKDYTVFINYLYNEITLSYGACMYLFIKLFKLNNGIKKSRMLRKLLDFYSLLECTYDNYNNPLMDGSPRKTNYFVEVSDLLNPLEVEDDVFISIHPVDFLTMSHGENWTSCHRLADYWNGEGGNGCYHAGIMGLMCSPSPVVMYEVASNSDEEQCFKPKRVRSTVFISLKGMSIFQNVVYPGSVTDKTTEWRNVLQKILSKAGDFENYWKTLKSNGRSTSDDGYWEYHTLYDNIDSSGYFGYDDWAEGKWHSLSIPKEITTGEYLETPEFVIGNEMALCIDNSSKYLSDNDTIASFDITCECCGRGYYEDDCEYVENYGYVCENCLNNGGFYYCDNCSNWYTESTSLVHTDSDEIWLCNDCCRIRCVSSCDCCGELYLQTEEIIDEDGNTYYYCNSCVEDCCGICDNCGCIAELDYEGHCYDCKDCDSEEEDDDNDNNENDNNDDNTGTEDPSYVAELLDPSLKVYTEQQLERVIMNTQAAEFQQLDIDTARRMLESVGWSNREEILRTLFPQDKDVESNE